MKELPEGLKPDLSKETTLDRIYAWYMEGEEAVQLTQKELLQKDRYKFAFAAMLEGKLDHEVVEAIAGFFGVSQRQAYRDVAESKKLYADINKTDKEGDKYLISQYLTLAYQMSLKNKDIKNMIRASAALAKIKGLEKNDQDRPDPEMFKPHTYILEIVAPLGTGDKKTINLDAIAKLPAAEYKALMDTLQENELSDLDMIKLLNEAAKTED